MEPYKRSVTHGGSMPPGRRRRRQRSVTAGGEVGWEKKGAQKISSVMRTEAGGSYKGATGGVGAWQAVCGGVVPRVVCLTVNGKVFRTSGVVPPAAKCVCAAGVGSKGRGKRRRRARSRHAVPRGAWAGTARR